MYDALYPPDVVWTGFSDLKHESLFVSDGIRTFEVVPKGTLTFSLVRMISPYVEDYLDARYQPGREIALGYLNSKDCP
ncbi:MAG: hypothetical protein IMX04_03910 [Candidatus Carbobacillus altaicus]|nr:hypothetical protein [Candidatus Carbobacillus altaicus]